VGYRSAEETAVAHSLAIRVTGGSIEYTSYYNVFVNKVATKRPVLVTKHTIEAGHSAGSVTEFVGTFLTIPATAATISGVTPDILAAATLGSQWVYAKNLRMVWLVSIPFGVCAIIACCFLGNTSKFMTNRVAARIQM
jgi:hypothetical protein